MSDLKLNSIAGAVVNTLSVSLNANLVVKMLITAKEFIQSENKLFILAI